MKGLFAFIASPAGRIIRIVAGLALIAWGLMGLGGSNGYIVAAVGVAPLLSGLFNFCVIAPVCGYPLSGSKLRS
jgi:hypothetical protein